MSLCISPICPQPEHSQNLHSRYCLGCGSDLLLYGRYRVMRLLSDNSGFGRIYEAFEQRTPKILKVLKENLNNNAKAVELFQQEAKVLGQLNHPGIPKVDGYFPYQTKNGLVLHCLIMEKIEGLNLEQWLQQQGNHPISQQQAIAWLKQLAQILDLVHQAQWFHRDIKPPNIMLRASGQLVLIDFGTARDATHTYLAKIGAGYNITAVVSAGYTPPEQINYQAVPQSDFFALGRTFVHLLTGKHPLNFYDAHNDVFQWRQAVNISSVLADFLDNLMARKPGDRPLNTEMLLKRIEDVEHKLSKKDNKYYLVLGIGVLLMLGGVIGYGVSRIGQSPVTVTSPNSSPTLENPYAPVISPSPSPTLENPYAPVTSPSPSPIIAGPSKVLVTSHPQPQVKKVSLENVALSQTLTRHSSLITSLAINRAHSTIVSASWDNTIKIWNLGTGELIRTLTINFSYIYSLAISPDGQTLVSGSEDDIIKIWKLGRGELIRSLTGHSGSVYSVAISPDGQTLVSSGGDKTIKIWNLTTGELIRTLTGHSEQVVPVAISPDGQTLVSGSYDKTIKIWNLATGELIRTLTGHSSWVHSVAISPDGQMLVSGDWNGTIKIWRVTQ